LAGGGFATLNKNYNGKWELNIFNNDGTNVVESPQSQSIPQNGGTVVKTYHAIQIANVVGSDAVGAITEAGANVIMALTSIGGFDIHTRSKTTGAAVGSVVDAGVAPALTPAGRYLTNPRLAPAGDGGWGMTYDDLYSDDETYYATASTYQIGFLPANLPPTISDVGNHSTAEGTATGAIAFTIGDAETAAASLTVSASSSNTTLVPNTNIGFGGSGANRTATITPVLGQTGTTTITLTVTDANEATASDIFVLTVSDNTPPTIVSIARLAPAAQTIGAATSSVTFRITYSEPVTNVSAASFALEALNGGDVVGNVTEVSGTGAMRDVTVAIAEGSGEFRLNAID
jgi:hypothetical protein